MLTDTLNNLAELIGISNTIIPNIITLIVVVIILGLSLKGQLSLLAIGMTYGITMAILQLLGIESVFNIVTLIDNGLESLFG